MDSTRLAIWIAIGMGIGVAIGSAFGEVGLGVALGPTLGVMIWAVESAHRGAPGPGGDEVGAGGGDNRDDD